MILSESRRVSDWHVEMMEYDFYSGIYQVKLMLDNNVAHAKIPAEDVDEVFQDNRRIKRKKIKHLIRDAVKKFHELEVENE